MKKIDITIIVPVYNVEVFLPECIESLLKQDINCEIILVNDGSVDTSGKIMEYNKKEYSNIITIHQEHSGPSAARNQGLKIAKGEYITFIDSDDWIAENSLSKLYRKAIENDADIVRGNMEFTYVTKGNEKVPGFDYLNDEVMTGKECFVELMKGGAYYPMACGYIYRTEWVRKHNLQFKEGIIHEDDLWILIAMCLADSIILANIDYYYYRQREGSIMHSENPCLRLSSVFKISEEFILFASRYKKSEKDRELQCWIYMNAFRVLYAGFQILAKVKDSSYSCPKHSFHSLLRTKKILPPDIEQIHKFYATSILKLRKIYFRWKLSPFSQTISGEDMNNKKIILIYNNPLWHYPVPIPIREIPNDCIITLDRKYFECASVVVFHLPDLRKYMNEEIEKPNGQLWVSWNMECEENYLWMKDEEIRELFDIRMDYRQDADVVCPYYANVKEDIMPKAIDASEKENKICMLISSPINQSGRIGYLHELMQYVDIDSYGRLFNNKKMEDDNGRESKLDTYSKYKFVIAFENAVSEDYITEKFYDPLLAGSVPVYLGAPNIEEFAPGDNCYINVKDFESPEKLADYLKKCMDDNEEYMKYHGWRNVSFRKEFVEKVEIQDTDPFFRLCKLLEKKALIKLKD